MTNILFEESIELPMVDVMKVVAQKFTWNIRENNTDIDDKIIFWVMKIFFKFSEVMYIKRLLKTDYWNWQESYAAKRRRFLEFQVDDMSFHKVSPTKV